MDIGLREFLRKFQRAKLRELAGETVTVHGRNEIFILKKVSSSIKLLGWCKEMKPKKKLNFLISMFTLTFSAANASGETNRMKQMEEIESQALILAKELCGDDLGCRYLREDLEKERDREGRNIQFNALALYVSSTLAPKLTKSLETDAKLKELDQLFEEHIKLEHAED